MSSFSRRLCGIAVLKVKNCNKYSLNPPQRNIFCTKWDSIVINFSDNSCNLFQDILVTRKTVNNLW